MSCLSNMSKGSLHVSCRADRKESLLFLPYLMRQSRDSLTNQSGIFQYLCTLERRYSSRTFRYGYLVTT